MTWLQLRLDADPATASDLEDALLEIGAAAVTMEDNADQPVYEPGVGETPVWQHTRVTGLFTADTDMTATLAELQAHYQQDLPPLRIEILEDRDWVREWMDSYHPIQCGDRLWICPSWREPIDPDAVNLLLDPGLAFGTGTHPTTWLCMQWLDQQDLSGLTVIDYGCGSGILGIAALLLGAEKVIAVDNDPQALLATRDNARRNNISDNRIDCLLPEQIPDGLHGDMVVANILAGPLISLASTLAATLNDDAPICLSGILHSQAEELMSCYEQWFSSLDLTKKEEWVRISGHKRNR
ncbi:Ribosomal protein L11 methyltransferase [Zhongshania aliphaticivorans]|uniref:Ribosomal protein L11 methyltransferase n=1 Tax=Zhongshania aliphaticivorans TaxID=1470434 RepID=A0A5S9N0N1_9GAMM|nr:50S ribosomal protein L11 methyltransferase [Zhongshania aliphaticivorans]CAA0082135.1 Ribosomal protein L11 methyltransferase [Zhongshania aliphaticivorans]CAA0084437.1 Ribosomal protein L11 methyltransferase [Zhongshania aliphaticivorans]